MSISGAAAVGSKLVVSVKGTRATSYAWFSNGKRIATSTSRSYTVKKRDAGRTLRVKVTTSAGSVVSKKLRIGKILKAKKVSVRGTAELGGTLVASTAKWKPHAVKLSYRWVRNGVAIPGASRAVYTVTHADAGATVSVQVTGSKRGYTATTRASSTVVVAAPPVTDPPTTTTPPQNDTTPDAAPEPTPESTTEPTPPDAKPTPVPEPAPPVDEPAPSVGVLSGASGNGTNDGTFDAWRESSLDMIGTWSDDNANMVQFWQLQKGGAYANWDKPIDVAIGGISWSENWASAAAGSYDSRWIASLKKLRELRMSKSGTTYIRFAHEMNGNWYPWSVNVGNYQSFVSAWKHFRSLQKQYYPEAQLVFNLNRESVGTGMDWRKFFPGAAYVDVLGVDYYNHWPYVSTEAQWAASINAKDGYGAPKGIEQYRAYAESVGLPLSISEWANTATNGDSPEFIKQMHAFTRTHGGTGAGQIAYEIYFNVIRDNDEWHIFGAGSKLPLSASMYRRLF